MVMARIVDWTLRLVSENSMIEKEGRKQDGKYLNDK
jgi:hypothetical protein